ncbi:MAG: hypothetical protein IKB64_08615 [Paludibacteraceae bacterium]|nr:hypothetical protein [Paludibacteraceae bacterium]
MAKIFIEETTLTSIGDAIRDKEGTTDLIPTTEIATRITNLPSGGGSDVDVPEIVLTGNCSNQCRGLVASEFIKTFPDKVSTKDITDAAFLFYTSTLETIPFELNFSSTRSGITLTQIFADATNLKSIPKINGCSAGDMGNMFSGCNMLREIPEDIADWFDWTYIDTLTSSYSGSRGTMFSNCYSLRSFPMEFLTHGNPVAYSSYSIYYMTFFNCRALDEIVGLPFPHLDATFTSNVWHSTFNNCNRLKNLTFALDPETNAPYVVNWKSQVIDLTTYVGYTNSSASTFTRYASGITADKAVTDAASYEALKNDPDWFTTNEEYSRYNHDSAVATINSLPDTSAYLATAGGTNTIKFKGTAGSLTDGGSINTLTEEEIAVATAKGWTVTLS